MFTDFSRLMDDDIFEEREAILMEERLKEGLSDVEIFDNKILLATIGDTPVTSLKATHSSRLVFHFDKFVVKIEEANRREKERQCLREAETYKRIEEEDRKYFVKVLASGKVSIDGAERDYIIQEKVDFIEGAKYKPATIKQADLLDKLVFKYEINDVFLGTIYNHNVVPIGNEDILIWDFGY